MGDSAAEDRDAAPLVTGQIVVAGPPSALRGATIHVYLEDVSYADAAAVVLAESIMETLDQPSTSPDQDTRLLFVLHAVPGATAIDPDHAYAIRVWVDRDGDGRPAPDDLYSDQRYPVLTQGYDRSVTITLTAPR